MLRLLWIVFKVAEKWIMLLKMEVWEHLRLSFKFGLLFIWWILVKSSYLWSVLMLFMYLELMRNSLSLFWDDLEALRGNFAEILKFCRIRIQWLFSRPVLCPTSSDYFHAQCHIQCLVTIFTFSDHFESNDQFRVQ